MKAVKTESRNGSGKSVLTVGDYWWHGGKIRSEEELLSHFGFELDAEIGAKLSDDNFIYTVIEV